MGSTGFNPVGRAREYASSWGSALVVLENAGHINVASGFGPWPEGFDMLAQLRSASDDTYGVTAVSRV